jgi:hypothetical protein
MRHEILSGRRPPGTGGREKKPRLTSFPRSVFLLALIDDEMPHPIQGNGGPK